MDNQAKHSRRKVLKVGVTALAAFHLPDFPTSHLQRKTRRYGRP
jgi:hypothetical protein